MKRLAVQCDGIKALLGIHIVAGIGPPRIELDAMVLPNQVLDCVNTPCVEVSKYWKIKPPHFRHSLIVTVSSLGKKTVRHFNSADPRAESRDEALVVRFCTIRATDGVNHLHAVLILFHAPILIEFIGIHLNAWGVYSKASGNLGRMIVACRCEGGRTLGEPRPATWTPAHLDPRPHRRTRSRSHVLLVPRRRTTATRSLPLAADPLLGFVYAFAPLPI